MKDWATITETNRALFEFERLLFKDDEMVQLAREGFEEAKNEYLELEEEKVDLEEIKNAGARVGRLRLELDKLESMMVMMHNEHRDILRMLDRHENTVPACFVYKNA